jgi:hypothetical protein
MRLDNPRHEPPTKRFTFDVPTALHTRMKIECARRGLRMGDVLRELIEQEFLRSRKSRGTPAFERAEA